MNKKINYQKGFTLIEMVIVIVVIGILMGIAFQGISGVQRNTRDTRRLADLRRTQAQLEMFFNRCGHYPNAGTGCGDMGGASTDAIDWGALITVLELVADREDIVSDPVPTRVYRYAFSESGLTYVLAADMEAIGTNRNITGLIYTIDCNIYYCIRS